MEPLGGARRRRLVQACYGGPWNQFFHREGRYAAATLQMPETASSLSGVTGVPCASEPTEQPAVR